MALADIAATVCAWLNAPEGSGTVTTQSSSSFLRPVAGDATAIARPLRAGRTIVAVDVDVFDAEDRLCVRVHQIQSVVARSKCRDSLATPGYRPSRRS